MFHPPLKSFRLLFVCLIGFATVLGLSGVVIGQGHRPSGPIEDIQATLVIILDRLNDIESKVDDLQNDSDNLQTDVDLRGVTQNWDKKLDSTNGEANGCNSDRFTCLWGNTVVRNNETGNVWERDPDTDGRSWASAVSYCADREVGGRKGWSLPIREQLATLVDTSNSDPTLPTGHPFQNVQSVNYWSASTNADSPAGAWSVLFDSGKVLSISKEGFLGSTWCVRGGQAFDGNTHETLH